MENNSVFRQPIIRMGLIMLILSFILYIVPVHIPFMENIDEMGLFFLHYGIFLFYFFAVLFSGRLKKGEGGLPLVVITLLLFLISAYALNRNMDVFHESTGWMQGLLIVTSVSLLVASLNIKVPHFIKVTQLITLTIAAIFYSYLALYLIPLYAFGMAGIIAIGIGLHAFVPALLLTYTIKILNTEIQSQPSLKLLPWWVAGACVLYAGIYTYRWHAIQSHMEKAYHNATLPDKTGWPAWVEVLQSIPSDNIAGRILRSDIVYTVPNFEDGLDFFSAPRLRWEESKKHDPLVVIASLFSGRITIPQQDRIKMLQTIHNDRYGAEERLWRGNNLKTVHMNTEVQIWPAMHLAYAEKTITVAQKPSRNTWRGNQQEAIYVFQLPEGAVVTSLSLWIDGKEEKSILTTKGKAITAYKTIVGVEARDPSVVHWLEGNRVSVRVFPVVANEQRIFKIGVTVPMPEHDDKIWFENFAFTGPPSKDATERVRVRLMQSPGELIHTVALTKKQENTYQYDGKYNPDLSIAFPAKPLVPHTFIHEEKAFGIEAYTPQKQAKSFAKIYADVNAAWTADEWAGLQKAVKGTPLFVYDDEWVLVDADNEKDIFNRLQKKNLTLFPFYALNEGDNSLVVTKSAGKTPSLEDIRESSGFNALMAAAAKERRYFVYHIGQKPSLYLSSLRELRLFQYAQGTAEKLFESLLQGVFYTDGETAGKIVIHNAGMAIVATEKAGLPNNAPDHLLRLFAYNHIMQQGGLKLLADSSLEESRLGELASYAHIVTPLSSMIVLEKQADYDRFGIDTNKEGLKNASAKNSGSVPEPHEWALIAVGLLLLAYYRFSSKINVLWLKK